MKTKSTSSIAILAALSVFTAALSCGGKTKTNLAPSPLTNAQTDSDRILLQLENIEDGLTILLSEGADQRQSRKRGKVSPASILSDAKANSLLARMPSLVSKKGDKTSFAFRPRSAPAPRTATKVSHAFPPPPSSALAPSVSGKLEVTRFSPEGEVPLAPQLSVSFSQPMVAITSHDDSVKKVPVTISPQPAGKWRWIGTKTLLFDPDVRFPMATEYQVNVAKGVKSANGDVLAESTSFRFATPALQMKSQYPSTGVHGLTPIIFVAFDQRIEPSAVLARMALLSNGDSRKLRMATQEEVAGDKIVNALVVAAKKRDNGTRWLSVTPD
ncbi:MAG: Ig-like domain-containing protein, partial [Kofleriaceae bacterium]|nr:Ig-like domain-containing protein [Kofleriaceae bacterium]